MGVVGQERTGSAVLDSGPSLLVPAFQARDVANGSGRFQAKIRAFRTEGCMAADCSCACHLANRRRLDKANRQPRS